MRSKKKIEGGLVVFAIVLTTLIASLVYSAVSIAGAPIAPPTGVEHAKLKSDYVLMLLECLLGVVVMFLPSMLERRLRIRIPGGMYIAFVVFLYAAIYLGEVQSFYYRFRNWDTVLHTFSGLMLGALGFSLINLLNDSERVSVSLSPAFVALFAFSFAVALGVVWEVYEFSADGLFGLNMQKHSMESGEPLTGRKALEDTMGDLIVDSLSALAISLIGYVSLRYGKGWLERFSIRRSDASTKEVAKAPDE